MKTEYIPKFITLLAGAVVCIASIVNHMDVTYSLEILLGVLVIFYLIGCIAKRIIEKAITANAVVKQEEEEKTEQESEDEEQNEKADEESEKEQA